jgi:hypothetical protein
MGQGVVAQDALITHVRKMQARAGKLSNWKGFYWLLLPFLTYCDMLFETMT